MKPRWTWEEIHYLKEAQRKKLPIGTVAAHIGRTENAIRNYASTHNIRQRPRWTEGEKAMLAYRYSQGCTTAGLLKLFSGKSRNSVYRQIARIKREATSSVVPENQT